MKKKEEDPFRDISCEEVEKNLLDWESGQLASGDVGLSARIKKHLKKPCIKCGVIFLTILNDSKED